MARLSSATAILFIVQAEIRLAGIVCFMFQLRNKLLFCFDISLHQSNKALCTNDQLHLMVPQSRLKCQGD